MTQRVLIGKIVLFAFAAGSTSLAQAPSVGAPAPAIVATSWLNWEGEAPTLESLQGRVVLLEFWGTWCGPCVRAMPGIQKLHDRYRERGLTVLAISYEPPATMQPFLQKNAFTMPVGSDPDKQTIAAYGIRSWPTTFVIDKEGKVAHIGSPYDAEAAVEKALGLEAGPAAVLDLYLDSLKNPDKAAQRQALQRLVEKAPPDFDLQAWAKGHLPPETVPEAGGVPAAAAPTYKPAPPAELLRSCVQSWNGKEAQRSKLLGQLAAVGPDKFDLAAFAGAAFAKTFPFDAGELKSLLDDRQYAAVVEAIAARTPAAPVLATAAKNSDLAAFCRSKVDAARTMAKKGLMAQLYVFPGALPKDEKTNREFFGELAMSGAAMSPDKKSITGILLGGEMLAREHAESFVKTQLTQAILMADLAAGKAPRLRELTALRDKEQAAIARDLEQRYGKPEPRLKK